MMTHTPMLDQSLIEDLRGLAQRNFIGLASCLGSLDHLLTKMATWVMEAEAHFICGARGKHHKTGFQRWGANPGSSASVWSALRSAFRACGMYEPERSVLCKRTASCASVAYGPGKRGKKVAVWTVAAQLQAAAQVFTDSLGLSASSIGNAFITQTAALLKAFETRRFDQHTFAVLLLDGKYLAGMQMIVAMGITTEGEKVVLGFAESRTENSAQVESLLQDLLRPGLHPYRQAVGTGGRQPRASQGNQCGVWGCDRIPALPVAQAYQCDASHQKRASGHANEASASGGLGTAHVRRGTGGACVAA